MQYQLRINPATPADLAAQVPERLGAIIQAKEKVSFDHVSLIAMDQNYLEYDIVYNMTEADYGLYLKTQQAVLLESMRMLRELGISTAPRAQELVVQDAKADGKADAANDGPLPATQARPIH